VRAGVDSCAPVSIRHFLASLRLQTGAGGGYTVRPIIAAFTRADQPLSDVTQGAFLMKVKTGRFLQFVALIAMAALQTTSADAGTIYSILNPSNMATGYTASGQIEIKNGTSFGTLNTGDISSWSWSVTNGINTYAASSTDSGASASVPTALSLQETGIYFNTSPYRFSLNGSANSFPKLYWQNFSYSYFNVELDNYTGVYTPSPIFETDATYGWRIAASPSPTSVPEIDPATGGSALSLVAGVLAMIEQRRRRRQAPTLAV